MAEKDSEFESYDDRDRDRGILTRRERSYLLGESDIEPKSQRERDIRRDIRERIWNGVLDIALIYDHVERRDLALALGVKDVETEPVERLATLTLTLTRNAALLYELLTDDELVRGHSFETTVEEGISLVEDKRRAPDEEEDTVLLSGTEVDVAVTIHPPERVDYYQLGQRLRYAFDPSEVVGPELISPAEMLLVYWALGEEAPAIRDVVGQWVGENWARADEEREAIVELLTDALLENDLPDE